ncbi:hypothetical protein BFS35_005755 [Macrococcoides goetzii]|uniref:Uncharacterized protein n=1 Tax=Macrococcoides goetzii TaxID=1891097 RepID=A0A395GAH5_9STAP|nr:hypothetical protein [Macrococcus goetzii]RAI81069.1 hypothetical protein BFS35_005755 [Macrococcus goetzii]
MGIRLFVTFTSNLLGAETIEELEQLEKVAFYIAEGLLEEEGFEFLFPLTIKSIKLLHKKLFGRIYSFAGDKVNQQSNSCNIDTRMGLGNKLSGIIIEDDKIIEIIS